VFQILTVESPEPGLGLTYGQTVGAIYQIHRQGYISAEFKADQDRVLAAIMRLREGRELEIRPEFDAQESELDRLAPAPLVGESAPPIEDT